MPRQIIIVAVIFPGQAQFLGFKFIRELGRVLFLIFLMLVMTQTRHNRYDLYITGLGYSENIYLYLI